MARKPTIITIVERGPAGPGINFDGDPGQIVGFDENGNLAALDPSATSIPAGTEGQVLGYGPGGVPQAVDAPSGGGDWADVNLATGAAGSIVAYDEGTGTLTIPRGDVGPTGPQGATGATGPAGSDGADGAQGPAGDQGPEGPQGVQGPVGPAGADGATGPQGPAGPEGPAGADGTGVNILGSFADESELPVSGAVGDAYLITGDLWVWDGADWVNAGSIQGPAGPEGPQGPTGATGAQGDAGPQGIQGIQGPAGADGSDGSQGPSGADGSSAYEIAVAEGFVGDEVAWLASLVGPQGIQGATGDQGPEGPQGDTGPQGDPGPQGIQGLTGPQGDPGPQGVAGADGSDGASAYEVAVAEGFVGDESAWLASLVGADGAQGPQGVQGVAGADGADGADGESVTITTFTDQGLFDAYTPGPLELAVLTES